MKARLLLYLSIASFVLAGCSAPAPPSHPDAAGGSSHEEHHWSYEGETGPEHWADLDPAYELARTGRMQSPIDLHSSEAVDVELPPLSFDYHDEAIVLVNNGHTIQHPEEPGSFMRVGGDAYELKQFHVHTPSEHTVDGQHTAMEVHLVHESAAGAVAVVALLVDAGTDDMGVSPLLEHLPDEAGEETRDAVRFDPREMLPESLDYFTYEGSLTTPPCTEHVRWIVLRQHVHAPAALISEVREILGASNRPVQPLHGREVKR